MRTVLRTTIGIILFAGLGLGATAQAQTQNRPPTDEQSPGFVAESERFAFFSHFWLNAHHFLHRVASAREADRSSPAEATVKGDLSAQEQKAFDEAVAFYTSRLVDKDLRSSDYMRDFKRWVIGQDTTGFSSVSQAFRDHTDHLEQVAPVYRQHFWGEHHAANTTIVSENLDLIRATEDRVAKRLAHLSRESWPDYTIRVDVTHYGKSRKNTAFTTVFPTHVVNPSIGKRAVEGGWVETLYHEAGHQLIRPRSGLIPETIDEVSEEVEGRRLRSLWHAYLFYLAGTVTKQALSEEGIDNYTMYMVREEVFSLYIPSLQTYLPRYVTGEATLAEVTRSVIRDVNERAGWGKSER